MSDSHQPIRIGIVGVGKIVRDQHLPALPKDADYRLVATASRNGRVDGVAELPDHRGNARGGPRARCRVAVHAAAIPLQRRAHGAEAGKHVFLEKPPGATVSEVEDLKALAAEKGVSLFASWHSRYAPAVEAARAFLAAARSSSAAINWKEDVRRWHPNQEWIWQAGGFGVFDPGINALSITTHILPKALFITSATLDFPENRAAPIAAQHRVHAIPTDWR